MAAISAQTFITDTLQAVDQVIGHFVQVADHRLIQGNTLTLTLLFTLYIMLLGYRFLTHTLDADIPSIARHLMVLLVVYGLLMNGSLYHTFIYNIFTNEPEHIARVLVSATGQATANENVEEALNGVYRAGMQAADQLFGANSIKLFFCSGLVVLFTFLACLMGLMFLVYAKMAMAMSLALGPLFLLFFLWETTRGWFVSWLRHLFTLALIPILTVTVLALMLSVINLVVPDLTAQANQAQLSFFTMTVFGGLSILNFLLLKQVFPLASALSGGLTLDALSRFGATLSVMRSLLDRGKVNAPEHQSSGAHVQKTRPQRREARWKSAAFASQRKVADDGA